MIQFSLQFLPAPTARSQSFELLRQRIVQRDSLDLANDLVAANLAKYKTGVVRWLEQLRAPEPCLSGGSLPPVALAFGAIISHGILATRALAGDIWGLMGKYEERQILLTHQNDWLSPQQRALLAIAEKIEQWGRAVHPRLARGSALAQNKLFSGYDPAYFQAFLTELDRAYKAETTNRAWVWLESHKSSRQQTR